MYVLPHAPCVGAPLAADGRPGPGAVRLLPRGHPPNDRALLGWADRSPPPRGRGALPRVPRSPWVLRAPRPTGGRARPLPSLPRGGGRGLRAGLRPRGPGALHELPREPRVRDGIPVALRAGDPLPDVPRGPPGSATSTRACTYPSPRGRASPVTTPTPRSTERSCTMPRRPCAPTATRTSSRRSREGPCTHPPSTASAFLATTHTAHPRSPSSSSRRGSSARAATA